jgi:hypothetical protein
VLERSQTSHEESTIKWGYHQKTTEKYPESKQELTGQPTDLHPAQATRQVQHFRLEETKYHHQAYTAHVKLSNFSSEQAVLNGDELRFLYGRKE